MKTRIFPFFICVLLLQSLLLQPAAKAQTNPPGYLSPGGLFDTLLDKDGNKYALGSLFINDTLRAYYEGTDVQAQALSVANCSSGYFELYLEPGCGFDTHPAALNVLCQVLHDLSDFINSPCTVTGQKVNFWVRNPANINMPSNALGGATPFFLIPEMRTNNVTISGTVDNLIWQTIISGRGCI